MELARQPLSEHLSDAERADLCALGNRRRVRPGQAVLSEGQVPDSVVLIEAGTVKILSVTANGDEVILGFRGPGDLIGEQGLFDKSPRSATVVAVDPAEYLGIPATAFNRYLDEHPRVARLLIAMLSERLREAGRAQIAFAAADTVGRVAARLLELADRFGEPTAEGVRVRLPLTQEELAAWSGASLEATTRSLRQLRELGWIETGRRTLVVRDAEALLRRAP